MQPEQSREGSSGRLQNFSLLDIIQMVCLAQRTGCLEVQEGKKNGRIFLTRGQIVHVETVGEVGEAALLEVLCWKAGYFEMLDSPAPPAAQSIQGGWEHVLMEAIRKRDEWEHGSSRAETEPDKCGLPRGLVIGDLLVEARRRRRRQQQQRRAKWRRLAGLFGALAVIAGAVAVRDHHLVQTTWSQFRRKVLDTVAPGRNWRPKGLPEVIVPAGDFVFQDGQMKSTRAFRIDAAEVTIWQYAVFLDQVGNRTDYDHPNQPQGKGHRNPDWDALRRVAFGFSKFHGREVTPNAPATFLDWFDAYAYARWRGRRLPTEEEWEKASRGPNGWRYPWGNAPQPNAANILTPPRGVAGPSDVAEWKADRSPYGAYDMAGNVSEWTASFQTNGEPVVKGGNFENESADLTRRILHLSPLTKDARIGFRTVVDEGTGPAGPNPGL